MYWKKLMKFQKHITLTLTGFEDGFTLLELAIAVSVATMLLTGVVGTAYVLHTGLIRNENHSEIIKSSADLTQILVMDTLNPNTHPRHPEEAYSFSPAGITFFANGGRVTYSFKNDRFSIQRAESTVSCPMVSGFSVTCFDESGFESPAETFPHSCEMEFTFIDKKTLTLSMRL
jgi:prepilin-type N-terminal cleavage/methylation domain-containing protein